MAWAGASVNEWPKYKYMPLPQQAMERLAGGPFEISKSLDRSDRPVQS
jgi:hypothetical protein